MKIAKLIGNVWATRKSNLLGGYKLMLAKIMGSDKNEIIVVVDTISAGIGDRVIITTGSGARKMLGDDNIPADAAIVGIIDEDCEIEDMR